MIDYTDFKLKNFNINYFSYDHALQLNPNLDEAWNNKGSALNNLGRHQEALEAYFSFFKFLLLFILIIFFN